MGLFSKEKTINAVCDGKAYPIQEMKDEAFSSELLGKGYMIEPKNNYFYSPVNGEVEDISESMHAYSILSDDGLEILIHIGIDTVSLNGEGFLPQVSKGEKIRAGDLITIADIDLIKEKGFLTQTAVIITNSEKIKKLTYHFSDTVGGKGEIIKYRL